MRHVYLYLLHQYFKFYPILLLHFVLVKVWAEIESVSFSDLLFLTGIHKKAFSALYSKKGVSI